MSGASPCRFPPSQSSLASGGGSFNEIFFFNMKLATRNGFLEPSPLDSWNLFYIFALNRLRRRELVTTETELKAMAAEANMGLRRIPQKG